MDLAGQDVKLEDGANQSLATSSIPRQTRQQRIQSLGGIVQERVLALYQKLITEGLLRQKPLKSSKNGRRVLLQIDDERPLMDERRGLPYISNSIRTARYNVYDFFPKQLIFQFTRLANFYLLCVGIPQTIPGLSTTGNYTTILPLLFFVLLTIAKEGYDDFKRHRLDKLENRTLATILSRAGHRRRLSRAIWTRFWSRQHAPDREAIDLEIVDGRGVGLVHAWQKVHWKDIRVGNVVRLSRDEDVPADLVLLYASGEDGLAYIDTMALDGETNLKTKEALPAFKGCESIAALRSCHAEFVLEDPNPDLYHFEGKVTVDGRTVPLTLDQVVYRGSTVRNTKEVIGIVINTGEECKIRKNANQHPKAKKPVMEAIANKIVLTLAFYVIVLSVGCSIGYLIWHQNTEQNAGYLEGVSVPFKEIIIGFFIMYNNIIPLALYVSLEIVRIGQLIMLNGDVEMYDEITDTPARCNTNTILENLGQVTHVFSDKTGTLTENSMKFRKMSIAGTSWLHVMDLEDAEVASVEPELPQSQESQQGILTKTRENTKVIMGGDQAPTPPRISITVTEAQAPRQSTQSHRRSSSQWRSTGRPDHAQPELNTTDLLEYMRLRPMAPLSRKARDYILSLALCHTCLPEMKDGEMDFQAASPDEIALVRAARDLGYLVVHRSSQSVTLKLSLDGYERTEVYEILDVIEFTSKRKRMSIIVKFPDGRICLVCKGADSMILPRLKLANLALRKVNEVRKSAELEHEMLRRSEQLEPRNSFGGRPSMNLARSPSRKRPDLARSKSVESSKLRQSGERSRPSLGVRTSSLDISKTLVMSNSSSVPILDDKFDFLDDPLIKDDSAVFTRCFKHLDEFATEGLRTLLFARKFVSEQEYRVWKKIYDDATTSLANRQELIEAAGDMIEQNMDLVGASAIEDKLQVGVPETIEKLRRANIKIWMLTGDKRETAINIAHSARICRPSSDIFILDSKKGPLDGQIVDIADEIRSGCVHSVVVIDGHTLGQIEQSSDLRDSFYTLIPTVDSVICCRASPSQKSAIVKEIRQRVSGALTLAIGDGANDLAMISASHVGVGISGKEGLQAARVADFAIAQFRYLQRLLLVHGRWNYIRTARFILATFWKESFFYLPQAFYQRYNGYTGTSLYQAWSLTVLNVLFTSLCVIIPGIFEQDLSAETLLSVPELYVYGQRNTGLNILKYLGWMATAAAQGTIVWFSTWAGYGGVLGEVKDNGLYALGDVAFSVCILWTNMKLFILEAHHKNAIVLGCFTVTVLGWWVWNALLSLAYAPGVSPYAVRSGFTEEFGTDGLWWITVIVALAILTGLELVFRAIKRNMIAAGIWRWPPWKRRAPGNDSAEEWHLDLWQEMEQDPAIKERLRRLNDEEDGDEEILGAF